MKHKAKKQQGKCIFCGQFGLSKEHVFPRWLHKLLPEISSISHHVSYSCTIGDFSTHHAKKGRLRGKTIYIVCKDCNIGWMSRLQERSKMIVLKLSSGLWRHLTTNEQIAFSKWVFMTNAVIEMADPQTSAITFDDRNNFYLRRQIPDCFSIWIAPYDPKKWFLGFNHFGWGEFNVDDIVSLDPTTLPAKPNTQSTGIALGGLFIQTFSSRDSKAALATETPTGMVRIWPLASDVIIRPNYAIDDFEADTISTSFTPTPRRFIRRVYDPIS